MGSHLSILDDLKLSVVMEVWVANRFDCGATYECELGTSDVSGGNYQVLHVKSLTLDTGEWMKVSLILFHGLLIYLYCYLFYSGKCNCSIVLLELIKISEIY